MPKRISRRAPAKKPKTAEELLEQYNRIVFPLLQDIVGAHNLSTGTVVPSAITEDENLSQEHLVWTVDASSGAVTVTLPAADTSTLPAVVKKIDSSSNAVTVVPNTSDDTIDGAASYVLAEQYDMVWLTPDEVSEWYVTSETAPEQVIPPSSDGPKLHDLTHTPLALWQCDDLYYTGTTWDVPDTSGNGYDISTGSGAMYRTDGRIGSATRFYSTALAHTDAAFEIYDELSVYCWVRFNNVAASNSFIIHHTGGVSGAEADNMIYSLGVDTNGRPFYQAEYGAGVSTTVYATLSSIDTRVDLYDWVHLGFTRATGSNPDVNLYLNGQVIGTGSTITPTGGSPGSLYVGDWFSSQDLNGALQSIKMVQSELTAAEMLAEYERCIGVV